MFATLSFIKYLAAPYFWSGILWGMLFLILFFITNNKNAKALFLNFSFILFVLAGAEFYFWAPFKDKLKLAGNMWSPEQYIKDDILGYRPPENAYVIGKKYYGNHIVVDMAYSTDHYGRRKSYPIDPNINHAILFFGCSLTFGEGINNEQTLPYLVGSKVKDKFNTYNFGYSGYGAHQMLAAIEHKNFLKNRIIEIPKYAIYTAIPGHIARVVGLSTWVVRDHDPKYLLNENREIYLAGHFDDNTDYTNLFEKRVRAHLSNSYILKKIFPQLDFYTRRQQNKEDIETYVKIVIKARDLFEKNYPQSEFHMILWDIYDFNNTKETFNDVLVALKKNNIRVHLISDILPGFYQDHPLYQLVYDYHPTPLANELIANYVVNNISSKSTENAVLCEHLS